MTIGALLLAAAAVQAQTTGNSNTGQQLFTTTLTPPCESCHSTTNDADAKSLKSIRDKITARVTPAGGGSTMSFAKALEAFDQALTGTSLGGVVTGMNGFYTLDMTQRADLAAFIAGLAGPTPILRYAPSSGPIFPATAVGATASATVTITNVGTGDLVIATNDAVTMATGGDVADFRVTASTCPGVTLRAEYRQLHDQRHLPADRRGIADAYRVDRRDDNERHFAGPAGGLGVSPGRGNTADEPDERGESAGVGRRRGARLARRRWAADPSDSSGDHRGAWERGI